MNEKALSLQDRIRFVRIRTFFENARGNPLSSVVGGSLFVLLLRSEGATGVLPWVWLAFLFLSCSLFSLFELRVKRLGLTIGNARRLFGLRLALGGVAMLVFGASVLLLPNPSLRAAFALLFILDASVVATAYLCYCTAFSYAVLIDAVVMVPFALACFIRYQGVGDVFLLGIGVAAVVWQIIFALAARRMARHVVGGIEVRERLHDEMSEREQAAKALRASQDEAHRLATMLRLICDNVPDMIWAKDLENRYLFANKALCEKLLNAADTAEPVGKTFDFFVRRERERHPDDPEWHTFGQFTEDVDRHTIGREEPTAFEEAGRVLGQFAYLDIHQARFVDAQGIIIGTVGCARDITARKASESIVEHLAHHDALTDLPNRLLMTDRLNQSLAQTRRDRVKLALLFVDLDKIKPVNDTHGHDVGDMLLKEAARRLREVVVRESDTVARLGGDEFVVVLPRVGAEHDVSVVADRILKALARPFFINNKEIRISASIGVALAPQHGENASRLLKNADAAMYAAKNSGRNAFRFFDPSMSPWLE